MPNVTITPDGLTLNNTISGLTFDQEGLVIDVQKVVDGVVHRVVKYDNNSSACISYTTEGHDFKCKTNGLDSSFKNDPDNENSVIISYSKNKKA
ncbi:TPA: hypothetical protein MCA64_003421 [Klebsiella pneumoniae]|jgi:hypothetical protein|uniref:hypothetical protein n=1 Tax=Klebsiella pneumoniae complex TaxID=3390273 RepID=UPI0022721E7D|nr:hypothetical protein [Klebsiella pneumoniae]MCY0502405.1 hypothetical protein [Klebsiella pneumoniae]HBQ1377727.1 hypothetical protein [Klebsiella pneumoniae]HBT5786968.1 hypothetical protein [Klebsiella pneumoniae]HEB4944498.1 hypothetical protein [Klebsiella quasipneumoniae]